MDSICCLLYVLYAGGSEHSKHLQWKNDIKAFIEHEMEEGPQYHIIKGHGVVVLTKTKQFILFGGNEGNIWNGYINSMWICNKEESDDYQDDHRYVYV